MAIAQEIIEAVRDATNISELIGEQVELKRRGNNLTGLCPFHSENTPSFSVSDSKGFYYCFGCGAKGNVFDFVMETRGFTFPEAVRHLAARAGIIVPESSRRESEKEDKEKQHKRDLRIVIGVVEAVYRDALNDALGKSARDYLVARGLSDEIIERYGLGFAPNNWDYILPATIDKLKGHNSTTLSDEQVKTLLLELGLIKIKNQQEHPQRSDRDYFDMFRARVVFPIHRSDGAAIAFGGRILTNDKNAPKYLNSPESMLYQKRKTLYGLFQAAPFLRKSREAFLVEGYFDVISLAQAGLSTAMATCGTAVTIEHAQLLKRFVDRVSLLFDGDAAGRKAAASCFAVFLNSGLEVTAVVLPEGEDPDSLTRGSDKSRLEQLIKDKSQPIIDIYLNHLRESYGSSAAAIGKAADTFSLELAKVKNPVEREGLLRRGAELLGVSFESLASLQKAPSEKSAGGLDNFFEPAVAEMESLMPVDFPPPMPEELWNADFITVDVKKPEASRARSSLEIFCDYLIVAVIVEPKIAPTILSLSLSHNTGLVVDILPPEVVTFLHQVAEQQFDSPLSLDQGNQVDQEIVAKFEQLLKTLNLTRCDYIDLALRQSKVGVKGSTILEEAAKFASRQTIHSQVQDLKKQESTESDLTAKLKLAQDKLLKKRTLTKLSR